MKKNDLPEEYGDVDDQVIGRAIRFSCGILVLLSLAGSIIIFLLNRPSPPQENVVTEIHAPRVTELPPADFSRVQFSNITEAVGIRFIHHSGATGEKLLPESLGGGVATFDMDADGDSDLLFVNGTVWPWDTAAQTNTKPPTAALYRNDTSVGGPIKFVDVTNGSGLDIPLYGMAPACGDFDNDGLIDVFITCVGKNRLYRNLGSGRFQDVSSTAGTEGNSNTWSTAATFIDYNNDGYLDLVVANYVEWTREIDLRVNFTIDGTHRAYGPPTDFKATHPYVYRNLGNGRFQEESEKMGWRINNAASNTPVAKSLGLAAVDTNSDGWIDVIVANDTTPNQLFINHEGIRFAERGALSGIAYDSMGATRGAMGIDVGYFRNSSDLGIAIGNFANEMTALYVSEGDPLLFTDAAIAEGIGPESRRFLKFSVLFFDYDLDGWLDFLNVNGHLESEISTLQTSQTYRQPAQLFRNQAGNGFRSVTQEQVGSDLLEPIVGRGAASADFDQDGDVDLVLTQIDGSPLLLRNDRPRDNRWIGFRLIGTESNRDALGTSVLFKNGDVIQTRIVTPTRGYLSQSDTTLIFGFPAEDTQCLLDVRWPSGNHQRINNPQSGMLHIVREISSD